MVLLFNGMQSSLAMVYDREMGMMRLLLTAPLPRWYLLFSKLVAGTVLSVLQVYAFLIVAVLFGVHVPPLGWIYALPAITLGGMMLGATGLLLSVYIRQLENFAGTMNFVIFPMFFISSALYPLWKLREAGAEVVFRAAQLNPFTYVVESVRFSLYGEPNLLAFGVVAATLAVVFVLAVIGYDPQRGAGEKDSAPRLSRSESSSPCRVRGRSAPMDSRCRGNANFRCRCLNFAILSFPRKRRGIHIKHCLKDRTYG